MVKQEGEGGKNEDVTKKVEKREKTLFFVYFLPIFPKNYTCLFFFFSFFGFSQLASRMPKGRSNRRILAHCQIGGDNLVAGEEAGGKSARMLVACLHFSADFPNR